MKTTVFTIILLTPIIMAGCSPPIYASTNWSSKITSLQSVSQLCTSFCLDNGDYCVFGTNMDHDEVKVSQVYVNKRNVLKTGWETGTTGKYARWISKYGSVTINTAGYQLVWGGMNEAGLMISTMSLNQTLEPQPDERPPLTSGLWVQYLLDNYSTVAEVIASEAKVRIKDARDHYLICDRDGVCAVIEFLDGKMTAYTGSSLPVKALTNSTYRDSLDALIDKDYWKIEVIGVNSGSQAESAGLSPGDRILAVDGVELEGQQSIQSFYSIIAGKVPGDKLGLTIIHPGEVDPINVEVQLSPPPEDMAKFTLPPGVPVQTLSVGFYPGYTGDFLARFATAADWVQSYQQAGSHEAVAYAFDVLRAVSRDDTVFSAVFDLSAMRIYFRSYLNPQIRYLDFSQIDFSCGAPVMMMDIHAAGKGMINSSLVVYSHMMALDYMVSVLPRWTDTPTILIETVLTGFENSACMEDNIIAVSDPDTYLGDHPALLPPGVKWITLMAIHHWWSVWIMLDLFSLTYFIWYWKRNRGTPWTTLLKGVALVILLGPFGLLAFLLTRNGHHSENRQLAE
jgi:penicillin V acylase-like amidase (Ntn superfamily)